MSRRRLSRWSLPPVAVATAFSLLVLGLGVGLRLPILGRLGSFPGLSPFDYSKVPGSGFAPLRDEFVRSALGSVAPLPSHDLSGERSARRVAKPSLPDVDVDVHPPVNDDRASARSVQRIPYRARTDTRGASREPEEPTDCGTYDYTVWYRYRPSTDGVLIAHTFGSDYSVALGVFDAAGMRNITCSSDARGGALATFEVARDHIYLFQIAGVVSGGDLVFTLEPEGVLEQISADHSVGMTRPGTYSLSPLISTDNGRISFLTNDPDAAPGFPLTPCWTNAPAPTTGGIFNTNVSPFSPPVNPGNPCFQVVVIDRFTGRRSIASVSTSSVPASSNVLDFAMSGDGRFIAFSTSAPLVPEDSNGLADIFVRDLVEGRTERVSVSSAGEEMLREDLLGSGDARNPSISHDGRYVFFESSAPNLISGDRHGTVEANVDVFVRDRVRGTTRRVSVSSDGTPADDAGVKRENDDRLRKLHTDFAKPCISRNGRFVAFVSAATNLASGDRDEARDVFLHDTSTHRTELLSTLGDARDGEGWSTPWSHVRNCVSDDGRYVLFSGLWGAADSTDLYVRDRLKSRTSLIARKVNNGNAITPDGRYVVVWVAGELVGGSSPDGIARSSVHIFDLLWRTSSRLTWNPQDDPFGADSGNPMLSPDGRYVAFDSCPGSGGAIGVAGLEPCSVYLYRRGGVA